MPTARIYTRLSRDKADQDSTARQEAEARALAARLGADAVEVYAEEPGTSGYADVARPERDRLVADLRPGDLVLAWAIDRLTRRGMEDAGRLLRLIEEAGAYVVTVSDGIDTRREDADVPVAFLAVFARNESRKIAARVRSKKRTRRDEGRWLGGPAPYGLRVVDGRLAHDPETYVTARRIADALLAGETLWHVQATLNAEGVPEPRGGKWSAHKVRRVRAGSLYVPDPVRRHVAEEVERANGDNVHAARALNRDSVAAPLCGWSVGTLAQLVRSPAFAGLQSIRRRLPSGGWAAVADVYTHPETGEPVSVGDGVVTPGERARILAALATRSTDAAGNRADGEARRTGRRTPRSLLGPLARCAACGAPSTLSGSAARRSYRCGDAAQGAGRCPGFTAPEAGLDEYVARAFRSRLAASEPGDPLLDVVADAWTSRVDPDAADDRRAAEDALAGAEEALARLQRLALSGVLSEDEAADEAPRLRRRVEAARERLAAVSRPLADLSPLLDTVATADAWDALDVAERRALLGLAVARVEVTRAPGRGYRFDPAARVAIVWRDDAETAAA